MKTDDLIQTLAAEQPRKTVGSLILFFAGALSLALAAVAFVAISGMRPDISSAWLSTALKISFGALAALALAPVALRAVAPNIRMRDTLGFAAAAIALALAGAVYGLATAPEHLRWTLWTGGGVPDCLLRVPLIALPIGAALFVAARKFGPTRLSAAGAALGATAGALAVIPYSLFCPIDSIAYVATWYTVSIGLCAALGAVAAPRLLRW